MKICASCGREITWRKKWANCWEQVRYCSDRCRRHRHRVKDTDEQLEQAILALLDKRAHDATICPSEAARSVSPDAWRDLMEPTRAAARRLCAQDKIEIVQRGQRVDPSRARGPIRLRRMRSAD